MSRSASLCIAYFMRYHGMSLQDAYDYVKARRPIIHPNVGFWRQLREYEAKIAARSSRQALNVGAGSDSSAEGGVTPTAGVKRKHGGDLVPGQPLPDLRYAQDEVLSDFYAEELGEVKARPKPRIPKPKPVDDYLGTCVVSHVQVMGEEEARRQQPPPRPEQRVLQAATVTVDVSGHAHLSIATCKSPEVTLEGVADSSQPTVAESSPLPPPYPPPRRNAFTKVSEPAKIAVSCLTVPQGLCAVFNPGQKAPISYQTPLTSHAFAEVMFTPQITETVVYQCAEHHIQQQVRSLTQTFHTTTFPKFEIFSK